MTSNSEKVSDLGLYLIEEVKFSFACERTRLSQNTFSCKKQITGRLTHLLNLNAGSDLTSTCKCVKVKKMVKRFQFKCLKHNYIEQNCITVQQLLH